MNRHVQRLGALVLTLAVLLGTVPATFAASDGSFGGDRGDGGFGGGSHGGGFRKGTFGSASTRFLSPVKGYTAAQNGDTCAKAEDTFHVAQEHFRGGGVDSSGTYYSGKCTNCGVSFKVYDSDIQRSYNEHTEQFPAQSVDSEGYLYWNPAISSVGYNFDGLKLWATPNTPVVSHSTKLSLSGNSVTFKCLSSDTVGIATGLITCKFSENVPVDGFYSWPRGWRSCKYWDGSGEMRTLSYSDNLYYDFTYYAKGVQFSRDICPYGFSLAGSFIIFDFSLPFKIKPLSGLIDPATDPTYNSSTRPGSSDFGFYFGDDNKLLSDNTANIVNEVNNTYYNPITNTTNNYNNWSYDYSSRTYTVNNTDNSTTTTITYGDEYVTIKEGDTVYNIYYYVQQDGSQTPATCQHEYTSAVTTAATCTGAGVMTYTCSKCQHSYTEAIPAKGHTWQVAQTVDPEQDAEGNVTKKGYTLYRCSVCATEYKDETGTGPPSTPGDSGGGGNSILDKLGQLIGSVFGGILEVLGGIISKILDALISLVQMLTDKLTLLVENILKIFDTLPAIFSGFLGFLGAVFGFLPEELLLVLEFGLIAVVFVGILLLIFKR